MKIEELREKTDVELERLLVDQRNKLRELRFKVASKRLGNLREIRGVRQTIAQILTLKKARPAAAKIAAVAPKEPTKA